ncbi:hypothetical protein BAUCODRAFT_162095 [Baudoinia panamericana UAMH 10762]|uniref:Uncharacterized protein n=1 Tax=Baudoinia panamericana (strain UAMH 10762) TaxID=717646 RepID=M2MTX4_BAUPA|nr:uncharacterized protein BAUCODRAFT_162095 [Baudoinia panamericana UAMH 10762]EMD00377.1 hypothetical protein BAUCODRAFT_162095 [Baudoinia panamericana UAMH 10762]
MSSTTSPSTSRSALGPLSSQFTPPAGCSVVIQACSGTGCNYGWQAQSCVPTAPAGGSIEDNMQCWPSATVPIPTPPLKGWGFYSPGVPSCPVGYTVACSASIGALSNWGYGPQFPLVVGETAIGCCPSGYECQSAPGVAQTCISTATTGQSFPMGLCSSFSTSGLSTYIVGGTTTVISSSFTSTVTTSEFTVFAPLIDIRWQSSDDIVTATSTTSMSTSSTTALDGTASAIKSATAGSGGLGVGAEAAVGVVVPVIVLLAMGVGLGMWLRRRRQSKGTHFVSSTPASACETLAKPPRQGKQQTRRQPAYEMEDQRKPQMLGADDEMIHELPGTVKHG